MSNLLSTSAAAIFEQQLLEARILRRVNAAAAKFEPLHVLSVLCAEITKALHADSAAFGRLNTSLDAIEMIAEYRTNGQSALGVILPLSGNVITPRVLEEHRPVVIADVQNAPEFGLNREAAMRFGIKSMMIVPIFAGSEVIGTLGIDSLTLRSFSPADQNLAMSVVQAAIPALKQTQMIETLRNELIERTIVEQALRSSERRFIDLVNNLEGIVFEGEIKNRVANLTFVSQRAESILGYSIDWWFSEPEWFSKPVHPDDRGLVTNSMIQAAQQRIAVDLEYRMVRADTTVIWVRTLAQVEQQGERLFWRGLTTDITALKNQQLLEQDRNHALELMSQGAPLDKVISTIAQLLYRQFNLPCAITAYENLETLLLAQVAVPERAVPLLKQIRFGTDALGMRQVLRQGQPYAFEISTGFIFEKTLCDALIQADLHHAVLMPMRLPTGEVRGGMVFFSKTPFLFASDPRIISSCDLAAIAIERHRLLASLEHQALHDMLTGLPNRALYNAHLEQTIAQATRNSSRFAMLHIDLNRFKQINDTHGHAHGDATLIAVARAIESSIRASDMAVRLGGDEFCIIAQEISNKRDAALLQEKVIAAIENITLDSNIKISAAVGFAIFPDDATSADTLYRAADRAMYQQKRYSGSVARG
jgi:diguanylate cyclase (GGDEF)-like protein/PAS domain S-box-containing protein